MARLLHFAAAVALGGLATAGLTACTGDAEASPSPTPVVTEVSETPSPTPTLTAEEELLAQIPEDARLEDDAGSINFSQFFVNESQRILETRDSALFELLSTPDCEFCASRMALLERLESDGTFAAGGEISFDLDSLAGGPQPDGTWNVSVDVQVAEQTFQDAAGNVVDEAAAQDLRVAIGLDYVDGHWEVIDISMVG